MAVYAHINTVPNGSTGGIMMKEHNELIAKGEGSYAFWGRGREAQNDHEMKFAKKPEVYLDVLQTRLDGRAGFHSKAATKRLLKHLDEIQPDVVHLHNLHGYYINIEMLFNWLAEQNCKVEWTLHDCWAFTGHCAHFTYVGCEQWQSHCAYSEKCSQLDTYPKTICKKSCAQNFDDKRRLFTSILPERMKLITPSHWLEGLVKQSFLGDYPVEVRYNTIDKAVFKPTPSDFRERYGIGDRFMILGVASPWTERKGLGDFIRLAKELDNEKYVIVLVGLSNKQIKKLPGNIIGIQRTESGEELASVYTAADVFVHPGVEETFGMTVAEAVACHTKVIVRGESACVEAAQADVPIKYNGEVSQLSEIIGNLRLNSESGAAV